MFLFLLFTVSIFGYYLWSWTFWKRRGINGPIGWPFLGSTNEMLADKYPPFLKLRDWTKKYGRVYGITEGPSNTLVISDPNMINDIFVKQFDKFYGRKLNPIQGDPNNDKFAHVFLTEGYRWKRLRDISSPTFANINLRKLLPVIELSARQFVDFLENQKEPVEILRLYQEFSMDVIGRLTMGQDSSQMFQNPLLPDIRYFFEHNRWQIWMIATVFPPAATLLRSLFFFFSIFGGGPFVNVMKTIENAIKKRIETRNQYGINEPIDFIDLFLDAKVDEIETDKFDEFKKSNTKVGKKLTIDEIIGQCFVFLVAGFDTTALTLTYISYLLATNPDKMRKVQKEINENCKSSSSISFDELTNLKYLDCVIKETLRLYPLATLANSRNCMKTTQVGDFLIEKGTGIQIDTWTLHHDPQIWGEDVEEFKPERFIEPSVDLKSCYLPFGLGPRQCIGMRLANTTLKLLLARILMKFDFETCEKTTIPLNLIGRSTTAPDNLYLKLRSH
ncbi:unnamed protein product [Caenorhabditis angaria]|uniref:Cytochrome P450 n=1 Tax=Caenorhabditis angaria TaxID=860376 RepID=A0A9P1ICE4_9PELO|nr:unnamed protein product [Caenorhabditis angaria]